MNDKKVIRKGLIILLIFIVCARGYYIRNLKVDNEFISVISKSIQQVELKRVNNELHTFKNYRQTVRLLNSGDMNSKSSAEIKIAVVTDTLSEYLYKYHEALEKNMADEADEALAKYQNMIVELQDLLYPYREKNSDVKKLWEDGIFN